MKTNISNVKTCFSGVYTFVLIIMTYLFLSFTVFCKISTVEICVSDFVYEVKNMHSYKDKSRFFASYTKSEI